MTMNGYNPSGNEPVFTSHLGITEDRLQGNINEVKTQLAESATVPKLLGSETTWDNALQRAHDAVNSGGTILLPQGATINFTKWVISKKDITIEGNATLTGQIEIRSAESNYYLNLRIKKGLIFTNTIPIIIRKGVHIYIENNTFLNCDKAILIQPQLQDYSGINQCVSCLVVKDNYMKGVNYAVKGETLPEISSLGNYADKISADISIIGNQIKEAIITHVQFDNVDGMICKENKFFHWSYSAHSATKQYCVRVTDWGNWLIISDNECFEAGYEAIYLTNVKNSVICGNAIAWPGQRDLSSGIKIDYPTDGTSTMQCNNVVKGNTINNPTKHGVELANVTNVESDNVVRFVTTTSDLFSYYGTTDYNSIAHYALSAILPAGTSFQTIYAKDKCNIIGNEVSFFNPYPKSRQSVGNINTGVTNLPTAYDKLTITQPSATTITSLDDGVIDGQRIMLIVYNSNTTIQHNAKCQLAFGLNFSMQSLNILELIWSDNRWNEINRNVAPTKIEFLYLADAQFSATPDYSGLAYAQVFTMKYALTSPHSITSITGRNGQQFIVYANDTNLTINNSAGLKLKGGVNVTLPQFGAITFIRTDTSTVEISRNF